MFWEESPLVLGISGWSGLCGPGAGSLLQFVFLPAAREQVSWHFQVLAGICPVHVALAMESIKPRHPVQWHPPEAAVLQGGGSPDLSF